MIDLAAIRQANAARKARQDAATPGPWDTPYLVARGYWIIDTTDDLETIARVPVEADAAFIAASRTDEAPAVIDQLCAEVERLRKGLQAIRAGIGDHPTETLFPLVLRDIAELLNETSPIQKS